MSSFQRCLLALLGSACLEIAIRAFGDDPHPTAQGAFCGPSAAVLTDDYAFAGLQVCAAVRVIVELSHGSVA